MCGLLIEAIRMVNPNHTWNKLVNAPGNKLAKIVDMTITPVAGKEISSRLNNLKARRNRILHSYRCTAGEEGKQILGTKEQNGPHQFLIDEQYMKDFIFDVSELSYLLDNFRTTYRARTA